METKGTSVTVAVVAGSSAVSFVASAGGTVGTVEGTVVTDDVTSIGSVVSPALKVSVKPGVAEASVEVALGGAGVMDAGSSVTRSRDGGGVPGGFVSMVMNGVTVPSGTGVVVTFLPTMSISSVVVGVTVVNL